MRVNKPFLLLVILPAFFVASMFLKYGESTWAFWNIPTLLPSFIDARIITASAESHALGFKPEIENPQDPYGRLFNLPSAWKILFLTGIDQADTNTIAWILIASFVIGLIGFANQLEGSSAWVLALCAFSPPVFLAFERGNVDLFIFFICALSLIWLEKNQRTSLILLWIAGILKIYPIFGLISFLSMDKKTFGKYLTLFGAAFGIFVLLILDGFRYAFSNTEVGFDLSYGLGVLPFYLENTYGNVVYNLIAGLSSIFIVILIILFSFHLGTRSYQSLNDSDIRYLPAFRLGAGIYIGTFLLGNNWDYRLIFLLFTLPQLVAWSRQNIGARYTLIAAMISFFYLWLVMFLPVAYFIDEFANWIVFGGLFFLMIASFPDWIKHELIPILERYKRKST